MSSPPKKKRGSSKEKEQEANALARRRQQRPSSDAPDEQSLQQLISQILAEKDAQIAERKKQQLFAQIDAEKDEIKKQQLLAQISAQIVVARTKRIAESDAQLKEKDAQLKELRRENKTFHLNSIKALVSNKLPSLPNNHCSLTSKNFKRSATIAEDPCFPSKFDFEPNFCCNRGTFLPSQFLCNREENGQLIYNSIADVQGHVRLLFRDALKSLRIAHKVEVISEMSYFSMWRDLVTVSLNKNIALMVKVKNPGPQNEFGSCPYLEREVFDYLNVMVQQGHELPIVILTTYQQWYIARLPHKDDEYKKLFEESLNLLEESSGILADIEDIADKKTKEEEKKSRTKDLSPMNADQASLIKVIQRDSKADGIVRSKVIESEHEDCFRVLLFGIVTGILSTKYMDPSRGFLPKEGEKACDRGRMMCVTSDTYSWRSLNKEFHFGSHPLYLPPFYLISVLGMGHTGKTFLAANESGLLCALKFYLRQSESDFDKVKLEKERWHLLYEERFEGVCCLELNNLWCLLMPFLYPVPKEKRLAVAEKVQEKLVEFGEKGYVYMDDDVRWRHVGCTNPHAEANEFEIVMIDLESLRCLKTGETYPTIVDKQMKSLEKQAPLEWQ